MVRMKMCQKQIFLRIVVRSEMITSKTSLRGRPSILLLAAPKSTSRLLFCHGYRNSLRIPHCTFVFSFIFLWFLIQLTFVSAADSSFFFCYCLHFSEPDLHIIPGCSAMTGICHTQLLQSVALIEWDHMLLAGKDQSFFPRSFASSLKYSTSSPAIP